MAVVDYRGLLEAYEAERPRYEHLAAVIGKALQGRLRELGIDALVLWRAKDVISFVKKALRSSYADPLREIGDKAGVRVIVHFLDDVQRVEDVVGESCIVLARDAKLEALDYDQLGYLGVHLDVNARAAILGEDERAPGLRAELQIHTKAQSAWSVVSHQLLYKTPVALPTDIKRGVTRLVALVELFDAEIERFRSTIRTSPEFKDFAVLEALDDLILQFTTHRPDRALSQLSISALVALCPVAPNEVVPSLVAPFIEKNRFKLSQLYAAYEHDSRATPLLFQPEALLVFERMDTTPDLLREAWPTDLLPLELLLDLATVWGVDLEPEAG